jgi:hypothetical protein
MNSHDGLALPVFAAAAHHAAGILPARVATVSPGRASRAPRA